MITITNIFFFSKIFFYNKDYKLCKKKKKIMFSINSFRNNECGTLNESPGTYIIHSIPSYNNRPITIATV